MSRSNRFWSACTSAAALLGLLGGLAACGGGGGSGGEHINRPVVRAFSPFVSPINFSSATLTQNPTFTDGKLTVSTDPTYLEEEWRSNATGLRVAPNTANSTNYGQFGRIVIFFEEGGDITSIDPASVLSADPADPLDHSALLVTQAVPNAQNVVQDVILPISEIKVTDSAGSTSSNNPKTRIVLKPAVFARQGLGNPPAVLPNGQYRITVFKNVRAVTGAQLDPGPVYHTFTVGNSDTIQPFVVNTNPADQQTNVGAGVPPPAPPQGVGASQIADVRTNIFGPTSPDILITFNEPVRKTSVNENNIQVLKAGQGGFQLAVAPQFPKLKSQLDGETLPSNGHEAVWRADPLQGGLPFQSAIQVTLTGKWPDLATKTANPNTPTSTAPISDLSNNGMDLNYVFTFYTVAPPDVPQNPFPEFAIWWAASDRVGTIDTVNQPGLADQFNGVAFPQGVPRNVVPKFTDTISTAQHIPGFSPTEIIFDQRTSATLCHSYVYVMSPESRQIVIINTRNSLPVALINTQATPGGLGGQFAQDGANVLCVTNSSANTFSVYDFSNITPGTSFLNGPIFIQRVVPTGNTPKAITVADSAGGLLVADWNRDGSQAGSTSPPLVMWADFTDGVINTQLLGQSSHVRAFALGGEAAPNDVVMTPCFIPGPLQPPILFAGISEGGQPGQGKVAYYVAGPGCATGSATPNRPDSLVGDLTGFDGPDGMDEVFSTTGAGVFFAVAESGSSANRVTTLQVTTGTLNLPRIVNQFTSVGANPTNLAHRPAWINPCIGVANNGVQECGHDTTPPCIYNGTEQDVVLLQRVDNTETRSQALYVCARGVGQVTVLNVVNGSLDFYGGVNPIAIQGVRRVASTCTQ